MKKFSILNNLESMKIICGTYKRSAWYALIAFFSLSIPIFAVEAEQQKLLVVMDLTSDNSVPEEYVKSVSEKISTSIDSDSTYLQFDRNTLPELFRQLSLDHSTLNCSEPRCLTRLGELIGANVVIGGRISYIGYQIKITLNLVDISKKSLLNCVSITSAASLDEFLKSEIPLHAMNLITTTPDSCLVKKVKKTDNVFSRPILATGTILVIGAATALYVLTYKKHEDAETNGGEARTPLSIDDIPIPTRSLQQVLCK